MRVFIALPARCSTRYKLVVARNERVYVTGVGVVSSVGQGRAAFFDSIQTGKSGIAPLTLFDATPLGRTFAGEIKDFRATDHLSAAEAKRMGRCSAMSLAAARMAAQDAGIGQKQLKGVRTAVVIGTTMGEAAVIADLDHAWIAGGEDAVSRTLLPKYGSTLLPIHIARAFGTEGMVMALPGACAAGNYAIGLGARKGPGAESFRRAAGAAKTEMHAQHRTENMKHT